MKKQSLMISFCMFIFSLSASSCAFQATDVDKWLSAKADSVQPSINVSGEWEDALNGPYGMTGWGIGTFEQNGSSVSGNLGSYIVKGMVSDNMLYLVLLYGGTVYYTANFKMKKDDKELSGNYYYPSDRDQTQPIIIKLKRSDIVK